ncbi:MULTISPECIES: hypothetical protein [Cyanophyceae]|uniref:hypothetical protein n=1 Tax=Cyanophyceae TaxID=3028117 RepID=UPI00168735EE|nr:MULTISPECIES: hypothetical protein [Cyanophyceae]MBD1914601.1 hypothetical protein [Phormidium sp. FACHB-77]MBD2030325.1 hypothetical protein [Phormidium sp. FACHB-322]MBD2049870.1 hypothetical protein [Leptolyngbya sp. FACHB-60]
MAEQDYRALHGVILQVVRSRSHNPADLADLFDLLGRLDPEDKWQFWAWLGRRDRNLKHWLLTQGKQWRAA